MLQMTIFILNFKKATEYFKKTILQLIKDLFLHGGLSDVTLRTF